MQIWRLTTDPQTSTPLSHSPQQSENDLFMDGDSPVNWESLPQLQEAAAALKSGGLVAFPTETVYGLGADACNEQAVCKVFAAKGRPADNPLIVHLADPADWPTVTAPGYQPNAAERRAMASFWPGPLTLLLPAHPAIAPSVHPGLPNIGVRVPAHPVARALIRLAGCPVAAPSANLSGRPSPTVAADVVADMADRVAGVVDAGPCPVGVESTVLSIHPTGTRGTVLRPGWVTTEELTQALGIPVDLDPHLTGNAGIPQAPGMKYRHYAPEAAVYVFIGTLAAVREAMTDWIRQEPNLATAVMAPASVQPGLPVLARWQPEFREPYEVALARELYTQLRVFDRSGARRVLVMGVVSQGFGTAIMNRLEKAASGRIIPV